MQVSTPDWLRQRGGEVRLSKDGQSAIVYFRGEPQYLVQPLPAQGTFSCRISQTINGKRLDHGATYKTPDEAVRGALEELRNALGW